MLARCAAAVFAATVLSACGSAETSATAPTAVTDRCEIHATANAAAFTATGGSGTVAVSTARDCTWTATSDASWVSLNGTRTGQGDGSVDFTVSANPLPSSRAGAITVGPQRIDVSQAGAPCRFSLSRSGDAIGFAGGRMAFDVSTLSGCNWSASASQNWIAIVSGGSGNASGTVGLQVSANPGGRRVADVNVAGQTYTVTQDAAPAAPAPPAPPPPTSPEPSPSPTPTPTPTPPSTTVSLEGKASLVVGKCPDISFVLQGEIVIADGSTVYKKGKCGDVKNDRRLKVTGEKSTGLVRATQIEIE